MAWRRNSFLFLSGLLCIHSIIWLYQIAPHHVGGDFFIYWNALEKISGGGNPYEPFHIGSGFLNHAFLLTLISPLKIFGNATVRLWVWWLVGGLAWVGALGLVGKVLEGRWGLTARTSSRGQAVFLSFLFFVSMTEVFYVGQVNLIVTFLICLCYFGVHRRQNVAAGVALGFAILLKTSPLVLLFYFVAVRNWRGLVAAVGTVLAGTAVSIIQFSPDWMTQFMAALAQISTEVHTGRFNQSVLALLGWVRSDGTHLLRYATFFEGLLLLGLVAYAWWRKVKRPSVWLFALFNSIMVIASPLVWAHHAVLLLLPLSLVMLRNGSRRAMRVARSETDRSHPMETYYSFVGMLIFSLFQISRLFEALIYPLALPSMLGMILLLIVVWRGWLAASPNGNCATSRQQDAASNGKKTAVS